VFARAVRVRGVLCDVSGRFCCACVCVCERERENVCVIMCECGVNFLADEVVLQKRKVEKMTIGKMTISKMTCCLLQHVFMEKKFPNLFLYSDKVLSKFHSMQ
jgi:hypothetical protein